MPAPERWFAWGERTYLMGIVNVTPDSFSGDGVLDPGGAARRARTQIDAGADCIDVGAESTRPGHRPVDAATELQRLLPALRAIRASLPEAIVSVDTYKPEVLRAAHAAGADMLNSIWGLPDPLLAEAADLRMPVVIMHNREHARYDGDVMDEVLRELDAAARRAVNAGIARERIVLDPGIGFGKTAEHNIAVLRQLARLPHLGFPTLIGISRKSTIGRLIERDRPDDRLAGSLAAATMAVAAGIDVVRVHDVAAHRDAVRVADAVHRGWRPPAWT